MRLPYGFLCGTHEEICLRGADRNLPIDSLRGHRNHQDKANLSSFKFMRLHFIVLTIIQLLFFAPLSLNRIIAGDEGFYLIAAKEVTHGALPYIDFFYPQMPLLPFAYGAWMKLVGSNWRNARLLSAVLTALLGSLLFLRVTHLHSKRWGYFSVVLFVGSQLVFPWYVTAKTYALSTLLLFGAYLLFVTPSWATPGARYFGAGVLFGLAVNTRLYFCSTLLVFFASWLRFPRSVRRSAALAFLTGGLLTALAPLYFMIMAFDSFWFCNMGYHLLRSNLSWPRRIRQKFTILKTITGFRGTAKFTGLQFPFTLLMAAMGLLGMNLKEKRVDMALYLAIVLFMVSFAPTPAYVQYFCVSLPFLLIGVVWMVRESLAVTGTARFMGLAVCVWFGCRYCEPISADLHKYTQSGRGVLSILGPKESKILPAMRRIANAINEVTQPGDRVLTTWPGVLVGSHARPYRGLENHFGLKSGHKIPASERERLHIMSKNDLWKTLKRGDAETVVLDRKAFKGQYREALTKYELVNATKYYVVLQRS